MTMEKIQQKGFSIYLVMIIMSTILAVSLNIGTIIMNSAKVSGSLGDGIRAFHAADSGIEVALYHVTGAPSPDCNNFSKAYSSTNFSYSVVVPADPCLNGTITSVGTYKTINKRTVKTTY